MTIFMLYCFIKSLTNSFTTDNNIHWVNLVRFWTGHRGRGLETLRYAELISNISDLLIAEVKNIDTDISVLAYGRDVKMHETFFLLLILLTRVQTNFVLIFEDAYLIKVEV